MRVLRTSQARVSVDRMRLVSLIRTLAVAAAIAGNPARAVEPVTTADAQAATPKVGERVRIAATAACPTPEDIAKLQTLADQKDVVGAEAYIAQKCLDLPAGTEFVVQSIGAQAFCGRPQGASDCLWMRQSAILEPGAELR
jgi:hypothetical protein